jgi:hypothetical protein
MIDPSLKKNLVHEDQWSRVYQPQPNFLAYESKFEDGASVAVEEISALWDSWDDSQRFAFGKAFAHKTPINKTDEGIYEFLIAKGNEQIWSEIALSLTRHSNKKLVLDFLLERLRSGSESKANFIQALYVFGDKLALPRLHELHDRLSNEIKLEQSQPDNWTIYDFLKCCEAIVYLEGTESYRDEIRPFLEHPEELVRIQAQMALAGPQPEEFGIFE